MFQFLIYSGEYQEFLLFFLFYFLIDSLLVLPLGYRNVQSNVLLYIWDELNVPLTFSV